MLNRLLFIFLMVGIAACSTTIEHESDHGSTVSEPWPVDRPVRTETSVGGVQGLIDKAGREIDEGDLDAGLATLERALRIAPRNASIYLSMARVYRNLGNSSLAANMARRGLLYCERPGLCRQLESLSGQ